MFRMAIFFFTFISLCSLSWGQALYQLQLPDRTLYLYGTLHMQSDPERQLPNKVLTALAASDQLWLELDPEQQQQGGELLMTSGRRQQGSFWQQLNPDQQQQLAAITGLLRLPKALFEPMEAWLVSLIINQQQLAQLGLDAQLGSEQLLTIEAERLNLAIHGLETAVQQIAAFESLQADLGEGKIIDNLLQQQERDLKEDYQKLERLWLAGDLEALGEWLLPQMSPLEQQLLLAERNHDWLVRLLSSEQAGKTHFVAVGAGHLLADFGLLELLQAETGVAPSRIQAQP